MIFGWPTFKIMCNTPIFYQLSMSNLKPGEQLQAPGSLLFSNMQMSEWLLVKQTFKFFSLITTL
jgi:hypothetical protein